MDFCNLWVLNLSIMSFASGWRGTNTIAKENAAKMPRRIRMDLWTPAEVAIHNALQEVEKMGADVRLTNAGAKLLEAQRLVADFVDSK